MVEATTAPGYDPNIVSTDGAYLIPWSVYNTETGIVRNSGYASTVTDCMVQALEDEKVWLGSALEVGTVINPDGTTVAPEKLAVVVTEADVKIEAGRRLRYTDWYVVRAAEDPTKVIPPEVLAEREYIRAQTDVLGAMDPIPEDYRDAKYWVPEETE